MEDTSIKSMDTIKVAEESHEEAVQTSSETGKTFTKSEISISFIKNRDSFRNAEGMFIARWSLEESKKEAAEAGQDAR